ncbi:MAG TPA: BT_3928 family protein, partial [Chitinophagaceae bacterium]|nr:BT_3928 family protein [Chitinophagaceae bacterium]
VGILFIFSGLIKANDPLGLSYKMQEFFEVWGLHGLNDFTLAFSVAMIGFEIIAGVAVLIGWQFRLFSWLLMLLILFFTFLTGYAVLSGKIRECGCFGDCIKLTAWDSFIKDLVLLGLILFLFAFRDRVKPVFSRNVNIALLLFGAVAAFSLQWYVLWHLPVLDCLPYKKGNNVLEKMKIPAGAIPDSTVITFVYKKDGKDVEFTADKFPADFGDNYVFVKRYDKVIRKGNAEAAIKDFALTDSTGTNVTEQWFNRPGKKLLVFVKNIPSNLEHNRQDLENVWRYAEQIKADIAIATSVLDETKKAFTEMLPGRQLTFYTCDGVAVKTASRTPITIYLINGAVIENKWSYIDGAYVGE